LTNVIISYTIGILIQDWSEEHKIYHLGGENMPESSGPEHAGHKKLLVLVTSLDGNLKHPLEKSDTVGDVHKFAYDRLVRQKDQIPFNRTWIEFNKQRQDESTILSSLTDHDRGGPEPDLILSLVWETGGGCL
jgi:hypothetical protein